MKKISIVIIAKNEELKLQRTLHSIKGRDWVDEIVLVDSGSQDQTIEIAKANGCRVIHQPFLGYGEQKNIGVDAANNDWILNIDADEVISDELSSEIQTLDLTATQAYGYHILISLVFLGRRMRYGRQFRKPHLRLFNRQLAKFRTTQVHEKVMPLSESDLQREVPTLRGEVYHYSYDNLHEYFEKFNHYTTLAARDLKAKKNQKSKRLLIYFRFPLTFLKIYLIHGSVLDGYQGFIWSMNSAFYNVIKYAKFDELKNLE